MKKVIDLKKTVFELVNMYPEVADVLASQGLTEIRKKAVLNSVGKLMTIPKGAKLRKVGLNQIIEAFQTAGFKVVNVPNDRQAEEAGNISDAQPTRENVDTPDAQLKPDAGTTSAERLTLLKSYLKRLNAGESLDAVRADFVRAFRSVGSSEIMRAEQELLREGEPLKEVQRLCDVHSALFHNKIEEAKAQEPSTIAMAKENTDRIRVLTTIAGHPLQTLTRENERLKALIGMALRQLGHGEDCSDTLNTIRQVAVHYAKKGDLLYPQLNVKYGIIGPSQVMWTLDDEIRAELSSLAKATTHDEAWAERLRHALQRANEMIYKEDNILFPVCAANFTEDEWKQLYRDAKDYPACLGVEPLTWAEAENVTDEDNGKTVSAGQNKAMVEDGVVSLPSGSFTIAQLRALLNTLPFEITFVDGNDINRYFNEGPKVFKRPLSALGREVFTCHPPKIEPMVRGIIDDFRNGRRDCVPVWMTKNGRATLVKYMAVRDAAGNYVGTMELVQDMEEFRGHLS
jgi:DUF438 domain-containing protein